LDCFLTSTARRAAFALILAWLGLLAAAPVRAETALDCFNEDREQWIPGCTALIESHTLDGDQLSRAYAMRALGYSLKGQYDRAIGDYDAALKIVPDFAVALNNRAWAYYRSGRGAQGMADVEKSLRLNPLSEHTWDTRAHIRQSMGNFAGALADYDKAIQVGGSRMVTLYQCGLKEQGLYNGPIDGRYNPEMRSAMKQCANSKSCDPLPADEQCRPATS
jgi:tetratricopeptide (TPR) repeat protein